MGRKVYLALGSNLGDRQSNLQEALRRLDICFGSRPKAVSTFLETDAVGFDGCKFINCITVYESAENPFTILNWCKRIEYEMGRRENLEFDSEGRRIYHDRIIDIDILKVGRIKIDTPELTLPHPQLKTRPYIKELLLTL